MTQENIFPNYEGRDSSVATWAATLLVILTDAFERQQNEIDNIKDRLDLGGL